MQKIDQYMHNVQPYTHTYKLIFQTVVPDPVLKNETLFLNCQCSSKAGPFGY
jgi:hypothetical protein